MGQAGFKFYLFRAGVRPCPKCGVRVEKNGGCPSMNCARCRHSFCWCCMESNASHDARCCGTGFPMCPRLPFNSLCVNLLLTLVAFILCPAVMLIGPIVYALVCGLFMAPASLADKFRYSCGNCSCCPAWFFAILVSWLFLLPLCLVAGVIASALAVVFGTLLFWFCCLCYLCIVLKNSCRFCRR